MSLLIKPQHKMIVWGVSRTHDAGGVPLQFYLNISFSRLHVCKEYFHPSAYFTHVLFFFIPATIIPNTFLLQSNNCLRVPFTQFYTFTSTTLVTLTAGFWHSCPHLSVICVCHCCCTCTQQYTLPRFKVRQLLACISVSFFEVCTLVRGESSQLCQLELVLA